MAGQPVAFDQKGPWISLALDHAEELDLSVDQVKGLTALREEFQKEAVRLAGEIRAAEAEMGQIYERTPVDLQAVEAKIRAIAGLEADLRLGRVKTLETGKALLTSEQQQKLGRIAQSMGWPRGAFMMGSPPGFTR
jgi:Spy/CpxP family protein refolding chaperone